MIVNMGQLLALFIYLIRCRIRYFVLCHCLMHKFYYFALFCCKVVLGGGGKLESQVGNGMIEENYLRQSRLVSVGFVHITIMAVLHD